MILIAFFLPSCGGDGSTSSTLDALNTPDDATTGETGDSDTGLSETTEDTGPVPVVCDGETPQKCAPVKGHDMATCWAKGTDCSTVHKDPTEQLTACKESDEAYLDSNGYRICCSSNQQWCTPNESGYPGGCHPLGIACETGIECGENWHFCDGQNTPHCDGNNQPTCCGGLYSSWCEPTKEHEGFCTLPKSNCNQALSCDGESWEACRVGEDPHCTSSGIVCCGGELPKWCKPGLGTMGGFEGGCFPPSTDCDSLTPNDRGLWNACAFSDSWGVSSSGKLLCCKNATPKLCELYDGVTAEFDGSECLPANANCDTLQKNTKGTGWNYCLNGDDYGVNSSQELVCCGSETPLFCAIGIARNGDQAYDYSKNEKPPILMCTPTLQTCKTNGDCQGGDMSIKCKTVGMCKQCIASVKQFATTYPGGCWSQNTKCNSLVKCGDKFHECTGDNCYCWDGEIYPDW